MEQKWGLAGIFVLTAGLDMAIRVEKTGKKICRKLE
jgi:hypothetical protein